LKKKVSLMLTAVLTAGALLSGCGTSEDESKKSGGEEKANFKVAMVTDTGGVDDKSFNQSAWEGLTKFGKDQGLEEGNGYKYLQSTAQSDYKPNLNSLIRQKYDLVFGIGFLMAQDVETVAQQQPDSKLAIVDMVVKGDNVANITFKEHEGSFLVGLIAGMQTKSNKVGFVGGVNSELIKKFENGFKAGVKSANPDAEILVQYAEDFNKAEKGQQIANTFYQQGADIIYHAAGGTGMGVFTEAKNRKSNGQDVWVIGVDRDQHEEGMPENVTLTSMVKRVDKAVYEVSEQTVAGKFPGGKIVEFGLEEDGVGIAPTKDNVSEEALKSVDDYKKKIIAGELSVPKTDAEYEEFLATLK
jgi:basic membrane protein A and related proteins